MRNLMLVLVLCLIHLPGCGAAPALPAIVSGAEIVLDGTCAAAEKLCEANDPACGSGACRVRETVCSIAAPGAPVQISCVAHPDAGQ